MKRTAALLLTLALVLSVLTPGSAAEAKTVKKNKKSTQFFLT